MDNRGILEISDELQEIDELEDFEDPSPTQLESKILALLEKIFQDNYHKEIQKLLAALFIWAKDSSELEWLHESLCALDKAKLTDPRAYRALIQCNPRTEIFTLSTAFINLARENIFDQSFNIIKKYGPRESGIISDFLIKFHVLGSAKHMTAEEACNRPLSDMNLQAENFRFLIEIKNQTQLDYSELALVILVKPALKEALFEFIGQVNKLNLLTQDIIRFLVHLVTEGQDEVIQKLTSLPFDKITAFDTLLLCMDAKIKNSPMPIIVNEKPSTLVANSVFTKPTLLLLEDKPAETPVTAIVPLTPKSATQPSPLYNFFATSASYIAAPFTYVANYSWRK